ncbi:penicillin-binding transpeptidase domain-containing protein [Kitasatospora kifunensis]|uniref:Penicillin-binding protein n=1 Tax=Kitasatospora kifunensis TaxID=58351 RepID=A0A7W7QXN1_KITKI|nr:penicillin-binding transpeptidase domain-containing protein [Kitasatospora kifunensis]MBB4921560.1 hypothetical protein [Kitasatospora kifunensis]
MRERNKGAKVGIVAVCGGAAVLGTAGYGVWELTSGGPGPKAAVSSPRTVVAEAPAAGQAAAGAQAFLEAWAKGDLVKAGALTDDPTAATTALTAFRDNVKPSAVSLTASGPAAASPSASPSPSASASTAPPPPGLVPLTFKAVLEFAESGTPWRYDGAIGVVKMSDGKPAVHWTPSVIHPRLGPGTSLAVKPVSSPPASVVDRNGKSLAAFPSLTPLLDRLKANAPSSPENAGTGVVLTADSGKTAADPLFTITAPKPQGPLKLTLDAALQQAAEAAVQEQSKGGTRAASLVAVEPSTGGVLAVANAPAAGQNRAFLGATAPGSTLKVVTAAALLEAGVTPSTPVPCPSSTTVTGLPLHNDFPDARPGNTFADDFTQSCNTAFIDKSTEVLKPDTLPTLAKDVFGLGLNWKTGVTSFDAVIPTPGNAASAAPQYIGQGAVQANPLAMASVAATVQNGTFKQPILVPGMQQVQAKRQLSGEVLNTLRSLMNQTTRTGTGAAVPGIPQDAGSKTGTTEIADGKPTNSWFTAYRGNLAVAAEVEGGGHGGQAAGPAVVKLLKIGNQ